MVENEKNNKNIMVVISEEDSKRITSLRYLLIVFVIFIHCNLTATEALNYNYIFNQPLWVGIIKNIVCYILGNVAVPCFFCFLHIFNFQRIINIL